MTALDKRTSEKFDLIAYKYGLNGPQLKNDHCRRFRPPESDKIYEIPPEDSDFALVYLGCFSVCQGSYKSAFNATKARGKMKKRQANANTLDELQKILLGVNENINDITIISTKYRYTYPFKAHILDMTPGFLSWSSQLVSYDMKSQVHNLVSTFLQICSAAENLYIPVLRWGTFH